MSPKRILLAEDDTRDVELILAALEEIDLASKVDIVNDGESTLDYLFKRGDYSNRESSNPIFLMLDLKMPKVSGLEVLKAIKENDSLCNIPIVILSSSKMESDILNSYKNGGNAYIVKPVAFEKFIETVKKIGSFWANINETPPNN